MQILMMMFLAGVWSLSANSGNILISLISLELMSLGIILMMEFPLILIFMVFVAAETGLGLSLVLNLSRSMGSDMMSNLNSTMC